MRCFDTQDRLFNEFAFERLIELGLSPTLTGMATHTLNGKYETRDDSISRTRSIFCHAKHAKEIYHQFEDGLEAEPTEEVSSAPAVPSPTSTPVAAPASAGPAATVEDTPIKAVDILSVIVAQKWKKRVEEVSLSKSIKNFVGGKSTLQNKILDDLQQKEKNFLSKSLDPL